MSNDTNPTIAKSWRRLLLELELARNHHRPYLLSSFTSHLHRNPILEYLLPALLYVKTVSILDEALAFQIETQGLLLRPHYQNTLKGRIDCLADQGILTKPETLHIIRERRNEIAHEADSQATWDELNADLDFMEEVLKQLGFVGERPQYEFYARRSGGEASSEPGVLFTQEYRYGLKENGQIAIEVSWTERVLKAS